MPSRTPLAFFSPSEQSPFDMALLTTLVLATASLIGTFLVCSSRAIRFGAALIAGSIASALWMSPTYFAYNRLFVGALFGVAALANGKTGRLHLQGSLLYLGAAVAKLVNPAWRSGEVLLRLTREIDAFGTLWSPLLTSGQPYAPIGVFHQFLLSYTWASVMLTAVIIISELAMSYALLRRRSWGVPLVLGFHFAVFVWCRGTFGMFAFVGLALAQLARTAAPHDATSI